MNKNRHQIKSLLFDIIFDDERRAQELYDDIQRLHYRELEQVICRCLDEYIDKDKLVQMDSLELDLGTINYRELNPRMANMVYESLSEKLKEIFNGVNRSNRLTLSAPLSKLDALLHFLENGYLPWNVKENVTALLKHVLKEDSKVFAQRLKNIGAAVKVRNRIVARFDSGMVFKIIGLLAPRNQELIAQFHRQFVTLISRQQMVTLSRGNLEKTVWSFILNHLLLNAQPSVQMVGLIKGTLIQFSEKFQLSFTEILMLLTDEFRESKSGDLPKFKTIFSEISNGFNFPDFQKIKKQKRYGRLSFTEKTQLLYELLSSTSANPNMGTLGLSDLQQHFIQLLESEPKTIFEWLKQPKESAIFINRMISLFSFKPIFALIRSLEPSHYETIISYQQNLIYFHQREPLAAVAEKAFSANLWDVIIHLLMTRSGSYFNQLNFLKNVIGQLSAHYNIDFYNLVERLQRIALQMSIKTSTMPVFLHLLGEIYGEHEQSNRQIKLKNEKLAQQKEAAQKEKKLDSQSNQLLTLEQHHRAAIVKYFQKLEQTNSLSMIRGYLLVALKSKPKMLLHDLQKQKNLGSIIERMVHDFDEQVIQKVIKAIEPNHGALIVDYQKNILQANQKKQVLPSSQTELSDALWTIILKMMLAKSSSKFNQKSFLKKLLIQTATHYNLDYGLLIDQLYSAIHIIDSSTSNYQLFIQLVQELQLEQESTSTDLELATESMNQNSISQEQNAKEQNTSAALLVGPRISESLVELIIRHDSKSTILLSERGFANIDEAIQHLILYQKASLISRLKKAPEVVLKQFIKKLPEPAFEVMIQASRTSYSHQIQELLTSFNLRLHQFGFSKRSALMQAIREKCLFYLLKQPSIDVRKIIASLETIIDQFHVPDAFFENNTHWNIPADGNLNENLSDLEQRLIREIEGQRLGKTKTTLYLEEIMDVAKKATTKIPYSRERALEIGEDIFISNAGLVILNGYIFYFFQQCGYLGDDGQLIPEKAHRAAVILQHVYDPGNEYGEEAMIMNKILCGLPVNEVLSTDIELSESEKTICDQMLDAIISHWKMVSNSSREGFRESWLQRDGKLTRKEKHWELLVEQRAFDILLDYKPFTLSPVKFAWMKQPIKVNWR